MRVLLYDLEVSPILGWTYKRWDATVVEVERESHLMCFAYKWLGEDEVHLVSLPDFRRYKREPYNDVEVVKVLHNVLNSADVVIAHNANRYDNRMSNERFLYHGLVPPSPSRTIDTLAVAKRSFYNSSNSLSNLCEKLGLGEKPKDTHSSLWHDCLTGDSEAWSRMGDYCKNDVVLLEKLYLALRPFITNHPTLSSDISCPRCGSDRLQRRGYAHSNSASYQRFQCQDCGGWTRLRLRDKDIPTTQLTSV